jgi:hypothetical protein
LDKRRTRCLGHICQRAGCQPIQSSATQSQRRRPVEPQHGFIENRAIPRRCTSRSHDLTDPRGIAKRGLFPCEVPSSVKSRTALLAASVFQQKAKPVIVRHRRDQKLNSKQQTCRKTREKADE